MGSKTNLRAEQRREEMESERKKLQGIKEMIQETIDKTHKVEVEFQDQKTKFTKAMQTLRNLEENQEFRRNRLDNDLNMLEQRQVDVEIAEDTNRKLKAELEEMDSNDGDYDKQIEDLEQEIKEAYLEWEAYKENQVMIEVGMDLVKGDDGPPLVDCVIQKRWQTIKVRQHELNRELAKIEKEISDAESEVANTHGFLKQLKEEETSLLQRYSTIKEQPAAVQ